MNNDLSENERLARLRLIRSAGVGPLTYKQLMARAGSAEEAVAILPDLAQKAGRRVIALADPERIWAEWEHGLAHGFTLLALGEAAYPPALAAIPDAPAVLWLHGDQRLLDRPSVAIVGARNASAAGRQIAGQLAEGLGGEGFVVTSGMARGIDGVAHNAALRTGTIAVLAGGADNIYPPEHDALYRAIAEDGLVISEQPLGMVARAKDFPKRNRIVSGLSLGTVVVEAAARSGTLITARLASEQGRDVFAVPGSPLDSRSAGTNALIKKGATLIGGVDDILTELAQQTEAFAEPPAPFDSPYPEDYELTPDLSEKVLNLLSFTPTHRDIIIAESNAPAAAVAAVLLDLVLDGRAEEDVGGCYVRSADSPGR
ncbi:MAG: DNA-processing protein DprA [Pseudomonadota bacterium]